jgi:hydrogenase maturation protein HypF
VAPNSASGPLDGRRIEVRGIVQGVGFRPWVYRLARIHHVGGWVRNDAGGVTVEAFGPAAALDAFVAALQIDPPPAACIVEFTCRAIAGRALTAFEIVASAPSAERRVSIPADLATCPDCLREINDSADRRFGYPFTNCTNCGPRFTIAIDIPYDRPNTTMAPFRMCRACQSEYESPSDRRFHAQPNACPACGPRLWLAGADGRELASPGPVAGAADAIGRGLIVAVKGLGGFHLACDATNPAAVEELRRRKRRDEKPFAVMTADLAGAEEIACLGDDERRLLLSTERPIVLARRREPTPIAPNVAPSNPLIGAMLPYTPLHHLLLAATGRPLVMTSGNVSDEPLAYRNDEAIGRLAGIADLFLLHDRDIDTRCDDSVARVIAGSPVVVRRSRGYVPRGIAARGHFADPVLACGALLKNTFCLGADGTAYLGPHIGDLENLETFEAYAHAIQRMERFLGARPAVIAHDRHPDYLSTRYALDRPEPVKVAVQHHHAHVCAAMAEHALSGPVIGVAYDGTGLGTDDQPWGGEVLVADFTRFSRIATFRPVRLAGGDLAIRQVWRQALAVLDDAFGGHAPLDRLPLFSRVGSRELAVVRAMLTAGVNTVGAHGVGRYFDAVGALALGKTESRYEGQVALEWNLAADPDEDGVYAFDIAGGPGPYELDLRQAIRALTGELVAGVSPAAVSARFHNTLAAATIELVNAARRRVGNLPVVLTGGVFQNALLVERIVRGAGTDILVLRHALVPPGDGGLALGQAVVASAVVQAGRREVVEDVCA